jgi:hypothetical protein
VLGVQQLELAAAVGVEFPSLLLRRSCPPEIRRFTGLLACVSPGSMDASSQSSPQDTTEWFIRCQTSMVLPFAGQWYS